MAQNYHVVQIVKYLGISPEKSPKILPVLKYTVNLVSNGGAVLLGSIKTH